MGGFVHQQESVERIAVGGLGRRDEPEVVRKIHPGWQYFLQPDDAELFVVGELVATAARRLNDDVDEILILGIEGGKAREIVMVVLSHA